ncbi:MAG: 50S ribosomal protein L3 [Chlamydiia bacterium]|nr:50S ribosomal protein L3 [Chlamydiia bacterium]
MSVSLIAKKVGMTQFIKETGEIFACTALQIEECVVVQVKSKESDGYEAIQIGSIAKKKQSKPLAGHYAKRNIEPKVKLFESRVESSSEYKEGDVLNADFFKDGDKVDVTGRSKGKGYQGVMKRFNFKGGPAAHGSGFHRHGGSTGMRSTPGRCLKQTKQPGHMGDQKITVEGLEVLSVDLDNKVVLVKGSVPGSKTGLVTIRKSVKKHVEQ